MAEMSLPVVSFEVTQDDLQLSIIAVSILQTMLVDKSRPDIQFFALKEFLHPKGHFAFPFEPELLIRTLDATSQVRPLEVLIDKLHGAYDGSL